jgi:hypothetical protein
VPAKSAKIEGGEEKSKDPSVNASCGHGSGTNERRLSDSYGRAKPSVIRRSRAEIRDSRWVMSDRTARSGAGADAGAEWGGAGRAKFLI